MDIVSTLAAILSLFAAIATAYFIAWRFGSPPEQGRYTTIDGLRGFLAFFVFLHHSSVWYYYLRTGFWDMPPSNLFTHFGQSSVTFFFMITGFLFFTKILDGKQKGIDWGRLFISRFMRLAPLYIFVVILVFIIVGILSNGKLNEPFSKLTLNAIRWLSLGILGAPNLNSIDPTKIIVAGVTWSLRYEWFFYFSLPLLALTVQMRPPLAYLIIGVVSVAGLSIWHAETPHLLAFLGGIMTSILVKVDGFRKFSEKKITSFLILGLITTTVSAFSTAHAVIPILLLSLAFSLIAGGNSLFKVLTSPVSRTLGEMAYSIYMLHGIVLFVLFTFVIGRNDAKTFLPITHWILVVSITPILILFCFCTFRFIEHPAMQSTNAVTAWLRSRLFKKST
jgi:peptidoglycan/LPS O-acetylase OafA/YrhL